MKFIDESTDKTVQLSLVQDGESFNLCANGNPILEINPAGFIRLTAAWSVELKGLGFQIDDDDNVKLL